MDKQMMHRSQKIIMQIDRYYTTYLMIITEENDNPLQYPCLENSMDKGAWQTTAHGVAELDMTERLHYFTSPLFWESSQPPCGPGMFFLRPLPPVAPSSFSSNLRRGFLSGKQQGTSRHTTRLFSKAHIEQGFCLIPSWSPNPQHRAGHTTRAQQRRAQ